MKYRFWCYFTYSSNASPTSGGGDWRFYSETEYPTAELLEELRSKIREKIRVGLGIDVAVSIAFFSRIEPGKEVE